MTIVNNDVLDIISKTDLKFLKDKKNQELKDLVEKAYDKMLTA